MSQTFEKKTTRYNIADWVGVGWGRVGEGKGKGGGLRKKFKPGAIIRDRKIDDVKYVPIDWK